MLNNDDRVLDTYYRRTGSPRAQEELRDRVHWILGQTAGARVLDIGCSQGLISILLGRAGFDVRGIDMRPEAISFAEAQLEGEPEQVRARVRFAVTDLDALATSEPPFDTIVLGEVLEHLSHPARMLEQTRRLLSPDGRVILTVPFGLHPDVDHKHTFYLSDLFQLANTELDIQELFVMHKFICCVARNRHTSSQTTPDAPYLELLQISERAFLEIEKHSKADLDSVRHMYAQTKRDADATKKALVDAQHKLAKLETELALLRPELTRLRTMQDAGLAVAQRLLARNIVEGSGQSGAIGAHQHLTAERENASARDSSTNGSPHRSGLVTLPGRLLDLVRARDRTRGRDDSARLARRRAAITKAKESASARRASLASAGDSRHVLLHTPRRDKLPLTVACILDDFSWENLQHDCNLIRLSANAWKDELRSIRPDFLLVESAWAGNGGQWQYKITYEQPRDDNPLFALLEHCKTRGIPTVFWNKEDPPNYERFIDAARRFDFIFTSDSDCVARYRIDAPGTQLGVLPFAAQPAIQNPVNSAHFEQLGDICFAGAWYPRHPDRFEDAKNLLDAARGYKTVIYDRYLHHSAHERHRFPDEYADLIQGSLSFEEMLEKYRQYRLFLNVNSVKDSPTMFSRRVLELIACGTPVVSGYARGIEELLGPDVVPMCRTEAEAREAIDRVLTDTLYRDSLILRGQRTIFSQHTYRHRLRHIATRLGLPLQEELQKVSAITATIRRAFLDNFLQNFQRQSYTDKELIVVVNEGKELGADEVLARANELGIRDVSVVTAPHDTTLGSCLNMGIEAASGTLFAKMDDDDYYGEHYLVDSVLALDYSGAECVGKESYFTYAEGRDSMYLQSPNRHHRFTRFVIGTTLVARKDIFPRVSFGDTRVGEDTEFLRRLESAQLSVYSHSPYNYVKFYAKSVHHHTWKVEEAEYLKNSERLCRGNAPEKVCF